MAVHEVIPEAVVEHSDVAVEQVPGNVAAPDWALVVEQILQAAEVAAGQVEEDDPLLCYY